MVKWIDLHVHAKLSKGMPFDERYFAQNTAHARRIGLDAIGLVEHMHGIDFWPMYDQLLTTVDYQDGLFTTSDGLPILTGAEISIRSGADLLLYAPLVSLRAFDNGIFRPASEGYKPTFREALRVAHELGIFVIGAHPFRHKKDLSKFDDELLMQVDAFELNGKDFDRDDRVRSMAARFARPVASGSDAHFWPQVGIKQTGVEVDSISRASVIDAIASHRSEAKQLVYGPIATRLCKLYKKIVKSRSIRRVAEPSATIAPI